MPAMNEVSTPVDAARTPPLPDFVNVICDGVPEKFTIGSGGSANAAPEMEAVRARPRTAFRRILIVSLSNIPP